MTKTVKATKKKVTQSSVILKELQHFVSDYGLNKPKSASKKVEIKIK